LPRVSQKFEAGLSTRRYLAGLELVGHAVDEIASATSKSAVSRKFVAMTETAGDAGERPLVQGDIKCDIALRRNMVVARRC
jgi:hypothetical protein